MSAALVIFITTVLLLGYIFVGYPLIVWLMARLRKRAPLRDADYRPSVEAVVIAHNEGKTIGKKIENLLSLDYPTDRLSILVVSDASSDETCDIVRALDDPRVRLMHFDEKSSKAACLNRSIASSTADVLLLTDCRQALAEDVLLRLVAPLADPTVAAASGELVFEQEGENDFSKGMDAYWRYEKFIRKCESEIGSTVGVTGAIYVLRRSAYIPIPEETLLDDVLIPMNVVMAGQRVLFESEAYAFDVPSSDPVREKTPKDPYHRRQFPAAEPVACPARPTRQPDLVAVRLAQDAAPARAPSPSGGPGLQLADRRSAPDLRGDLRSPRSWCTAWCSCPCCSRTCAPSRSSGSRALFMISCISPCSAPGPSSAVAPLRPGSKRCPNRSSISSRCFLAGRRPSSCANCTR